MLTIYNILLSLAFQVAKPLAFIKPKVKSFLEGQKHTLENLEKVLSNPQKTLWVHASSLGEYELAVPVMELFKVHYPEYRILLTFFSPSGYQAKRHNEITDLVFYLPIDSPNNARKFLSIVKPNVVFIIKNEFWPNYLNEIKKLKISTFLISGQFRENQFIFKPYGRFIRKSLEAFETFFVVNQSSKLLLESFNFKNIFPTGNTSVDRIFQIIERDNHLDFMEKFKTNAPCIVAGSVHKEDFPLLLPVVNASMNAKFVVVPHEINLREINHLKKHISKKSILYSEIIMTEDLSSYDVIIVDTVGILTKIYSYATAAYVGGGMRRWDLHNVLEPSVFEIPVAIGCYYQKFFEAEDLINAGGILVVKDSQELAIFFEKYLFDNPLEAKAIGQASSIYLEKNRHASQRTFKILRSFLDDLAQ